MMISWPRPAVGRSNAVARLTENPPRIRRDMTLKAFIRESCTGFNYIKIAWLPTGRFEWDTVVETHRTGECAHDFAVRPDGTGLLRVEKPCSSPGMEKEIWRSPILPHAALCQKRCHFHVPLRNLRRRNPVEALGRGVGIDDRLRTRIGARYEVREAQPQRRLKVVCVLDGVGPVGNCLETD